MTRWKTHGAQNGSRQEICARNSRESTSATHVANSYKSAIRSTSHLRTRGPVVGAEHSQFRHHIKVRPVWDMVSPVKLGMLRQLKVSHSLYSKSLFAFKSTNFACGIKNYRYCKEFSENFHSFLQILSLHIKCALKASL